MAWLLIAAFAIVFARAPRLLLEGRIYAEEGTTYLRYAWNATPLRALLAPHQGYYSLLDNVCALIAARLLPLSATALFFTWVAAAVQMLVLYLAIECEALRTTRERCLAVLALLLVTPNFETWLSLENCQSILVVAAAVILVSSTRRLFVLRTATLALAGLTSLTPVPLIPLFWLRAWKQRSRRALIFALSLTVPAIMQAPLLVHSIRVGDRPVATHELRTLLVYTTSQVVALPLTTGRGAQYYNAFLYTHRSPGWILLITLAFAALLVAGFQLFTRTSRAALLLYASALLSMAFSWYGCLLCSYDSLLSSTGGEGRYFFPANCMLLLALLLTATRLSHRWLRRAAAATFAWLMIIGAFHYLRMRPVLNDYPAWLPQVRRWQADEHQPVFIAPRGWTPLHLTRQHSNRTDLAADAYDSLSRHSVPD